MFRIFLLIFIVLLAIEEWAWGIPGMLMQPPPWWEYLMNWIEEADYWLLNHDIHTVPLVIAGVILISGWILPEIWHLILQHFEKDPKPNWPLKDALRYMIKNSEWGIGKSHTDNKYFDDMEREIRDAAALSELSVSARPSAHRVYRHTKENTPVRLSPDFWRGAEIHAWHCLNPESDGKVISELIDGDTKYFEDVKVNKRQFKLKWKKASLFKKLFDKKRDERLEILDNGAWKISEP